MRFSAGTIAAGVEVSLANPFIIAHRGGSSEAPEHSFEAYALAYSRGSRAIEIGDIQTLSDGSLALQHDDTVDRTTDGTGSVSTFTRAQWKALHLDTDNWFYGGYGNLVPPMFDEVVPIYAHKIVFFPEAKDASSVPDIVAVLAANGVPRSEAVISSFSESAAKSIAALGWRSMVNTGDGVPVDSIANLKAAGIEFVAMPISVAQSTVNNWLAAGFKYVPYGVDRLKDWALAKTYSASGCYSDNPYYLSRDGAEISLVDTWADGKWMPGMIGHTDRGSMSSGTWGWNTASGTGGMLLGFLGARSETSLLLRTTFNCSSVTGASQWFSMAYAEASMSDGAFTDGSGSDQNGYHCLFRANGTLQTYRRDNGTLTTIGTSTNAGAAYTTDGSTSFIAEMEITPTQVITRLKNMDGSVRNSLTVSDSNKTRGGGNFLHMRKNGWRGRFSSLSLTPS